MWNLCCRFPKNIIFYKLCCTINTPLRRCWTWCDLWPAGSSRGVAAWCAGSGRPSPWAWAAFSWTATAAWTGRWQCGPSWSSSPCTPSCLEGQACAHTHQKHFRRLRAAKSPARICEGFPPSSYRVQSTLLISKTGCTWQRAAPGWRWSSCGPASAPPGASRRTGWVWDSPAWRGRNGWKQMAVMRTWADRLIEEPR